MIHILVAPNVEKRSAYIKKIAEAREPLFLRDVSSKDSLLDHARGESLFGDSPVLVLENILKDSALSFSKEELAELAHSRAVFIFLEDKLLAGEEKKYSSYATISRFEEKKPRAVPALNTFAIADAFGRRDKITAWMLYREAIEKGTAPEAISGILFWKIKTMLLGAPKSAHAFRLKEESGSLVSLYHRAHRGECDFAVGLEQLILSLLSK